MNEQTSTVIALQDSFQKELDQNLSIYIKERGINNPDFEIQFKKTGRDLWYSQNDEMREKLAKTKAWSLMNAVFRATESGASFAKKEISFIPFEIFKKEKKGGADVKTATGEYEALVIFDINFQKQQILKLTNCKRFYTAEVHDGVEVISDLTTGNYSFDGKNDVTKETIGYYAAFQTTENEIYDMFMTCAEIIDRAKFSPGYKEANYKKTGKSIHFEKIVVRNLMKIIPKISEELKSVLAYDESAEFTEYTDVTDGGKALESAKKDLSPKKEPVQDIKKEQEVTSAEDSQEDYKKSDVTNFFS